MSHGVASGHTCVKNTNNPVLHPVHGSLCMIVGMNFVSIDASTTMRTKKVSYDDRLGVHTHTHTHTHTRATLYDVTNSIQFNLFLFLLFSL